MPKTPYFWHPVSVKLWPFFEFQISFSETAVKLVTVSREFSKCRLSGVKSPKNVFFYAQKWKFLQFENENCVFFSSVLVKIPENEKKQKKWCGFTLFETPKKVFLQVCKLPADNHVFFFTKSASTFRAGISSFFCKFMTHL